MTNTTKTRPSFTGFKRALRVGTILKVTNRKFPHMSGEREVLKVQTNGIFTSFPDAYEGTRTLSGAWMQWPKASEVETHHNAWQVDFVNQRIDGEPWLTIEYIK